MSLQAAGAGCDGLKAGVAAAGGPARRHHRLPARYAPPGDHELDRRACTISKSLGSGIAAAGGTGRRHPRLHAGHAPPGDHELDKRT